MSSANLGTKRICPKCDAKFYDFGVTDPIKCPKCGHSWRDAAKKKAEPKLKKDVKPVKPIKKRDDDDLVGDDLDLPEVADDEGLELEPMEDDSVEMTSLEEVEEHEEEDEEKDPNSDDADDQMFTEIADEDKLVDDLEDHLEDEDDEESDEDDEESEDDDDAPKKKKRWR